MSQAPRKASWKGEGHEVMPPGWLTGVPSTRWRQPALFVLICRGTKSPELVMIKGTPAALSLLLSVTVAALLVRRDAASVVRVQGADQCLPPRCTRLPSTPAPAFLTVCLISWAASEASDGQLRHLLSPGAAFKIRILWTSKWSWPAILSVHSTSAAG